MLILTIGGLAILLALPNDVVTSPYATNKAAREDDLFGRGWLPDILPPSAYNIRVSNDLDLNTSEGLFSFKPAEYSLLKTHLRPYQAVGAPFEEFEDAVARTQSRGFETLIYEKGNSIWVISCKGTEGFCEYVMWLRRDNSKTAGTATLLGPLRAAE